MDSFTDSMKTNHILHIDRFSVAPFSTVVTDLERVFPVLPAFQEDFSAILGKENTFCSVESYLVSSSYINCETYLKLNG